MEFDFIYLFIFLVDDKFICETVLPSISLQEHAGNDKSCVWHASDFADGELKDETFCIRFASVESKFSLFI